MSGFKFAAETTVVPGPSVLCIRRRHRRPPRWVHPGGFENRREEQGEWASHHFQWENSLFLWKTTIFDG